MREDFSKIYAVTDEKFDNDEFEKKVSETNRLKTKGIEVGHIFYFGDKYSKPMGASVDLPEGKKDFVKMGSYGIGVSRLVGAIIEAKYDEKNEVMKWPISVAPYDISIIPMIYKNDNTALEKAININNKFIKNDIEAIKPMNMRKVVDTTGAGDIYAGGFIHGLINNYSLKKCGEIASICAGHIITQLGSRSNIDFRELIKEI